MSNKVTIPYAAQLACRHLNTSIPGPSFIANSSVASRAVSQFLPSAEILSTCCNTTTGNIVEENSHGGYTPKNLFEDVPIAGYAADGSDWRYCNVTGGQSGIDAFDKCLNSSLVTAGVEVQWKCFTGGAKEHLNVTSDGHKIQWRSNKKKKQTVSAALLIALGVAGIILGA